MSHDNIMFVLGTIFGFIIRHAIQIYKDEQ